MRHVLLVAAVLFLSTAAAPAQALSLNAAVESERESDTQLLAKGFSAGIWQSLGDYFFAGVGYSRLRTEPFMDGDLGGRLEYVGSGVDLGAGYGFMNGFGLSGTVGYARSEVRGLDGFEEDPVFASEGPSGSLTLSMRPSSWAEMYMGPAYSYLGREPAWQGNVGLALRLLPGIWVSTGFWRAETTYGWTAGLSLGN